MKVLENTHERLLIESRPVFLWVMLYGLGSIAILSAVTGRVDGWASTGIVLLFGCCMIWVGWRFEPLQRFEFDRPSGVFTHKLTRLTGTETWTRPLAEIRSAADQGHWNDGSRMERVVLLTNGNPYPLESGFTGQDRSAIVGAINSWLGNQTQD